MNTLDQLYQQIDRLQLALIFVVVAACLVCLVLLWWSRRKRSRMLHKLDEMLDLAIDGEFDEKRYDESGLSKTEAKLGRFLGSSNLKKDQMKREQEQIKSLISDISHQTKTPVANIVLYAQLLAEREQWDDETRELAVQIVSQGDKLNFLIQSLIKASRLESGIIKIEPSPGEVKPLIESALATCAPKAAAKEIALNVTVPTHSLRVVFDRRWVTEALYNVLDNAVKYTPVGGAISVSLVAYEMFVCIEIADNGMGIAEGEITKIFDRFWRSPDVRNVEGVGIGLYLAREIIAACGGYMKVQSQRGIGTTFSVFLPKA